MLTPAECRLQRHDVSVFCPNCRMLRPLDLRAFVVSEHDNTPFGELWKARLFKCRKCGSRECSVLIDRVKVGTTERLEEWRPD